MKELNIILNDNENNAAYYREIELAHNLPNYTDERNQKFLSPDTQDSHDN